MPVADTIISLKDGRIHEIGSPETLIQGQGYVGRLGLKWSPDGVVEVQESSDSNSPLEQSVNATDEKQQNEKRHTDVRRKNGEKAVYNYYLQNAGWKVVILYTVSLITWVFFCEFSSKCKMHNSKLQTMQNHRN